MKLVDVNEIVEIISMQSDESSAFVNTETGEIIAFDFDELAIVDDLEVDDDFSEYPEWQRKLLKIAVDVIFYNSNSKYILLPSKWDVNEYRIMEDFCGSVSNDKVSEKLFSAIRGTGAFRRFKDEVIYHGVDKDWYKFRDETYLKIAVEWCTRNDVIYK